MKVHAILGQNPRTWQACCVIEGQPFPEPELVALAVDQCMNLPLEETVATMTAMLCLADIKGNLAEPQEYTIGELALHLPANYPVPNKDRAILESLEVLSKRGIVTLWATANGNRYRFNNYPELSGKLYAAMHTLLEDCVKLSFLLDKCSPVVDMALLRCRDNHELVENILDLKLLNP